MSARRRLGVVVALLVAVLVAGVLPPPDNPANGLTGYRHGGR